MIKQDIFENAIKSNDISILKSLLNHSEVNLVDSLIALLE